LLNWVCDVRRELQSRIYEGCRRYTPWNSVVAGSLKTLQEGHHTKSRAWISISAQQSFVPTVETNEWPYPAFATNYVPSWGNPTGSVEYYASQSSAYPGLSEDVFSLHELSLSGHMAVAETYRLPTGLGNHPQLERPTSSPFPAGDDLASSSMYAGGSGYVGPSMHPWTPNSVPGADQRSTYVYSSLTDTSRSSQPSDVALIEDPIRYNPLLHEPRLEGEYPSDVELDD
jgi:hypothetical protein